MNFSENEMTKFAKEDPEYFSKILLNPHTSVSSLTSGIEILISEVKDEKMILDSLKSLLKHKNAVVREGACYAAANFYSEKNIPPQEIVDSLKKISVQDPSLSVREGALILLEKLI